VRILEKIVEAAMRWAEKNDRVMRITGTAGPEDVYLIRYYIVKSKYFNLFIHQFLRSDRDDLHDHPWNFCTFLVRGSYTEKKWNEKEQRVQTIRRKVGRRNKNRFVFRKATDQHQVLVDRDLKLAEKDQAALTIFMSGPTKREWGFVKEVWVDDPPFEISPGVVIDIHMQHKERRWVDWRTYLGLPPNTPGRG